MFRFKLLGPLEVFYNGQSRTPSAPMQRSLLALLLLHANTFLPTMRIIDALWRGRPPQSAASVLQMYVTSVRRALTPPGSATGVPHQQSILRTMSGGYGVYVAVDQIDLNRFQELATRGRHLRAAGRCAEAASTFQKALSLWRGPALADLGHAGALDSYALRLEEDRLAVQQEHIGVELCQGNALGVVGQLEELVLTYPLSESLCQQLMLALHMTGRRAQALRVYQRIRQRIVDEFGIEPGPGLRQTQRGILGSVHLPETGYPGHTSPDPTTWICDPRIFNGWPAEGTQPVSKDAR